MFRVLLVPFLALLLYRDSTSAAYAAAAVFVVGAATDGLDGYLARRYHTRTRTGQWLDPLADKILVATPVVVLTILDRFPLWAAVVLLAREAVIAALRVYLGSRGRGMPASFAAKLKTVAQLLAITLYILPLGPAADAVKLMVLLAAVALTLGTGLEYVARAVAWVRSGSASRGRAP